MRIREYLGTVAGVTLSMCVLTLSAWPQDLK